MKMLKTMVLLGGMLLTFGGCSGEGVCKSGDSDCECLGTADNCTWDCKGGDCSFSSTEETESNFTCDDGGCSLVAAGSTDVNMTCDGGACTVDASGASDVSLSCAGGGCSVVCGGSADCTITECTDCECQEKSMGTCKVR